MRMGDPTPAARSDRSRLLVVVARLVPAAALGVAAAGLVSCGTSTGKLIPAANAGPLQSDFEAVAQAAQSGNGSCSETEAAIRKTETDFTALPASIDTGLHNTLRQGIANLRKHALELCKQPLAQPTTSTAAPKTTTTTRTTPTTTTDTQTTPTQTTTSTTPTTPTTSGPGGGTPAPGAGETPPSGGQGGGTPGEGAGAGGQEAAK
ncbi:MAG: hypothetical protein JWL67_2225 [Solirubrobacterales bacterium]|nr:hypothetical protein [Solirubrobacterales bacterium]